MLTAGVLASVALLTDSVPILIGAMVVAPAYPPLALTSSATFAREYRVALRGFLTICGGLLLAVLAAMGATWFVNEIGILSETSNLVNKELVEERVRVGWYSVIAALAAGIAGTIAIIKDKTDTLIGTVASVALVPAGAAAGIALISGDVVRAAGGLGLLTVNVLIIIGAGLMVFALHPSPMSLEDEDERSPR